MINVPHTIILLLELIIYCVSKKRTIRNCTGDRTFPKPFPSVHPILLSIFCPKDDLSDAQNSFLVSFFDIIVIIELYFQSAKPSLCFLLLLLLVFVAEERTGKMGGPR